MLVLFWLGKEASIFALTQILPETGSGNAPVV